MNNGRSATQPRDPTESASGAQRSGRANAESARVQPTEPEVRKEALRLHPIIPTLVPHQSTAACKASEYDIPAKIHLLVNV